MAEDSDSRLTAKIQNSVTHATLDGVRIDGFNMSLTFNFLGSGSTYSANGDFTLADKNSTALMARFTSTNVSLSPLGGAEELSIEGLLTTMPGQSSILVGGNPWVFVGDHQQGTANQDSAGTTITVANPLSYITGGLVALHYPVYGDYGSLEELFGALDKSDELDNGSMHAQITPVPVPATVLLGLLGLGAAGLKLRKFV
jgi:hypothetical protein